MERVNVHTKKPRNAKESIEKRSPLQDLNGVQIHKASSTIKSSNPCVEAPTRCSRFLLSSSTSSSTTHFKTISKTSSKPTNNASKTSTAGAPKIVARSKENKVLAKLFLHKSENNEPLAVHKLKYGNQNAKPGSKNGPRSKFLSDEGNPISMLKKGSQHIEGKKTTKSKGRDSGKPSIQLSEKNNLNFVEKCTPVGKVACGSALDLANVDDNGNKNVEENLMMKMGNNDKVGHVRTPPIQASVSPEIQFGSHSKILVSNSGATPVCYGAGHLLLGVTDRRKCRRRGSLKGGFNAANVLYGELNDEHLIISNLQDSSFPLLAGASVNWHLSPSDERHDVEGNDLGTYFGSDSVRIDLLSSSPSSFICVDASDLVCNDNGNYSGSACIEDGAARKMEEGINNILRDEQFSSTTSVCYSLCNSLSSGDEKLFRTLQIGNCSAFLSDSFRSGNKIQTPNSDSSSDRCVGTTKMGMDQRNFVPCEHGSISPTPNREAPWSMWDAPGFGSYFASPPSSSISITKSEKNEDVAISSWVSNVTTLDNFGVSEMKISWRDGQLEGGVIETNEEFDCCRCLSDEDDIGIEICEEHPKRDTKYGATNENDLDVEDDDDDVDISQPKVLNYEPIISSQDKENLASHMRDTCAESICTNGGSFLDYVDSDWTDCF